MCMWVKPHMSRVYVCLLIKCVCVCVGGWRHKKSNLGDLIRKEADWKKLLTYFDYNHECFSWMCGDCSCHSNAIEFWLVLECMIKLHSSCIAVYYCLRGYLRVYVWCNCVMLSERDLEIYLCGHHQHGYPWPFLTTSPYHSSLSAAPQGYTPYPHRAAVCRFELVTLLSLGHVKGSTGVHHLWARPYFSSSVLHVWFI